MLTTLSNLLTNSTENKDEDVYMLFKWSFERTATTVSNTAMNSQLFSLTNATSHDLIVNLTNQINCTDSNLVSSFPLDIDITQKTGKSTSASDLKIGNPAVITGFKLTFYCNAYDPTDVSGNYWELEQEFNSDS